MADIVVSIVAKVAEYLVEPAIRQGQYLLCVNKFIKDLENEKKELTTERDSLQNRAAQAKKRTEIIEEPVEKWLNDVENLLKVVEDLEQRMRTNNNCFPVQCPTWRKYNLCRQMVDKIKLMQDFKGKSNIEPFSHLAPLLGIHYNSSRNFTFFESTKMAYNQLLEALRDDSINMIGLYGMGGSGKTTPVTEVGKKDEELNLFDRVILVTVSQTPNIRSIQGKMADMLNLKLEEESEEGRAQRLWLRLKEENRLPIIADDLWEEFNLENVGVCSEKNYKGRWKILLTTRCQAICNLMDCQMRIQLGLLSEDEAWNLFQKHANIDDAFSKLMNDVPWKLCKECQGLPIAIVALGSSLKGKSNAEWEVALNTLRHSEANGDQMEEGVRATFSYLKLSYDYLKNKEAKLLFLMCSMFPEDYEIFTEDLIRYAVGLGIGGGISLDSARSRIRAGINKLVDSCLLMHSKQSKYHVKMHDMVRDVGLWIALRSEDHKILINVDKPLSSLTEDDGIKNYFAVSLWYKQIDQISCPLDAPNLEIPLLNIMSSDSLDMSNASYDGIEQVKVLAVINKLLVTRISLPRSNRLLINLRVLRLNGWDFGDLSFLTSLVRLEILDLRLCRFKKVPDKLEKIKNLKLLDLSFCDIQESCYQAMGKLSQLEELYASGIIGNYHDSKDLADILTLPNLQRFVINDVDFKPTHYAESMRSVGLIRFNISTLDVSKKNVLQIAEKVYLSFLCGGCKNIIPDMVGVVGGMKGLSNLSLLDCTEVECLIDTTAEHVGSLQLDDLIPRLVKLELSHMKNLKELCRGPPLQVLGFFQKLEELYIRYCKQLQIIFPGECNLCNLKILKIEPYCGLYINCGDGNCAAVEVLFSLSVAQSLQQLEELTIECCNKLKHIITSGVKDGSHTSEELVLAPSNCHLVFPNLKGISIHCCSKLEFILPISCVEGLAQLQEIKISMSSGLKYVFGHYGHEDHSSRQNESQIRLPLLKVLDLYDLENIRGICPENYHLMCPSLIELRVTACPKFTTCFTVERYGLELGQQLYLNVRFSIDESQQMNLTSNLKQLVLDSLPELFSIWSSPTPNQKLSLQYLQHLEMYRCEKLKSIFPMIIHMSLLELTSLRIYGCEGLEEIISETEELEQLSDAEICFPKLEVLKVKKCSKLKSLFSIAMVRMLPQLSILHISEATQLEEVFRQSSEGSVNQMEIVLPNLTKIKLHKLPSFVDICQGLKLQAVKLRKLQIQECPKTTSILRAIQVSPPEMMREEAEERDYYFDNDSDCSTS